MKALKYTIATVIITAISFSGLANRTMANAAGLDYQQSVTKILDQYNRMVDKEISNADKKQKIQNNLFKLESKSSGVQEEIRTVNQEIKRVKEAQKLVNKRKELEKVRTKLANSVKALNEPQKNEAKIKDLQDKNITLEKENATLQSAPKPEMAPAAAETSAFKTMSASSTPTEHPAVPNGLAPETIDLLKVQASVYAANHPDSGKMLAENPITPIIAAHFFAYPLDNPIIGNQLTDLIEIFNNGLSANQIANSLPLNELASTTRAGFIALSAPDKTLDAGPLYVFANTDYYGAIGDLSQAYPHIIFIRSDQANEILSSIINK